MFVADLTPVDFFFWSAMRNATYDTQIVDEETLVQHIM